MDTEAFRTRKIKYGTPNLYLAINGAIMYVMMLSVKWPMIAAAQVRRGQVKVQAQGDAR